MRGGTLCRGGELAFLAWPWKVGGAGDAVQQQSADGDEQWRAQAK
jgi:hypothetical protein